MNILAVDQARAGAWCVYDYEKKLPLAYDSFIFPSEKYTYAQTLVKITDIVQEIIIEHNVSAVFIEDIQYRQNIDSFKKLAQLQGSLVSMFERYEYLYDFVPPSRWQNFCNARGRTTKEIKAKAKESVVSMGKQSKLLSIQFIKEQFDIDTDNDNLADAICIGYWVVNNVVIENVEKEN